MLSLFCAQYGNHNSYYGNIQLGRFELVIQNYGAWPDDIPANDPMVNNYPIEKIAQPDITIETKIADNIAIIKRLRSELKDTEDAQHRMRLREQIEKARQEKIRQFQLKARIDEEETLFILLH